MFCQRFIFPIDVPPHVLILVRITMKHLIVEHVIKHINERIPTALLTNKAYIMCTRFCDERVFVPGYPVGEMIQQRLTLVNARSQPFIWILSMVVAVWDGVVDLKMLK